MTAHEFFYKVWLASVTQKRLPAPKGITTKSPALQRLSREEGKWIGYQLKIKGFTQQSVADRANRSRNTVANVLCGRISSANVYAALCELLGYASMAEMLASVRRNAA